MKCPYDGSKMVYYVTLFICPKCNYVRDLKGSKKYIGDRKHD